MRVAAKSLRGASGFRSNIGIVQEIDFQGRMSLASTVVSWAGERPIRTGVIARSSAPLISNVPIGGEAYFALAMEWRLRRGLRSCLDGAPWSRVALKIL